jgi:hypothetical protein
VDVGKGLGSGILICLGHSCVKYFNFVDFTDALLDSPDKFVFLDESEREVLEHKDEFSLLEVSKRLDNTSRFFLESLIFKQDNIIVFDDRDLFRAGKNKCNLV